MAMISPDAFDLTLSVRIGWITPDAVADTTMSRRTTGTVSYAGTGASLRHDSTATSVTAAAHRRIVYLLIGPPRVEIAAAANRAARRR